MTSYLLLQISSTFPLWDSPVEAGGEIMLFCDETSMTDKNVLPWG